jgi:hypothetical protein
MGGGRLPAVAPSRCRVPLFARTGHGQTLIRVLIELVPERPDRDAENVGRVRAVPQRVMAERVEDQVALDVGDACGRPSCASTWLGGLGAARAARSAGRLRSSRAPSGVRDRLDADDLGPLDEQHGAVDRIFELAHVAGKTRTERARRGPRPTARDTGRPLMLGVFVRRNARRARARRPGRSRRGGSLQVHDVEAIEQILAEACRPSRTSSARLRFEVAITRMSTGTGFPPPTRSITRSCMRAQELRLQPHVHFRDFVQQKRAARGLLELADAPGGRRR